MKWTKKGLIFTSQGEYDWNLSHAQVPTVDLVSDTVWRIYYASRDLQNRSFISYIEVEAGRPENILYKHNEPILPLGKLGTFDDSGLMPSWIVTVGEKKYLYYIGWNVKKNVPYHNAVGLAVSNDGGRSFCKCYDGPVMDRTALEPYFCATTCVIVENGVWRNWYLSCTEWLSVNGKQEPKYHLKYAESCDGVSWKQDGTVAIDYMYPNEGGIVRASVMKCGIGYKMWYSYRSDIDYRTDCNSSYRIGYAESINGINWERMDRLNGVTVSADGWDSFMVAYPHVIKLANRLFMFYNGNGFGQTGIGYAVADMVTS